MPAIHFLKERKLQIASILGMACVWPSLHNQLLYPISFSFHKPGADEPYVYYLIYSFIMLAITAAIAFGDRERIAKRLFNSPKTIFAIGIFGALGIGVLVICDFSHALSSWLMGAGVILAAPFVPVFFIFWSTQIIYASEKRAGFDLLMSYLVFSIVTILRILLKLHAWPFSIFFPAASALLTLCVIGTDNGKKKFALSKTSVSTLPLYLIIPSVIFVYIATATRCLLNPINATYDYPSGQRVIVYVIIGILCIVLSALYKPHGKSRRFANLPAFALTVALLACGILFTGLGTFDESGLGNLPTIAGINSMELIIWLFVLANAQVKHSGILRSAALYLIFVVGACHLTTVLFAMGVSAFDIDPSQLPLLAITIALAFFVVIAVNTTMTAMLYRVQKRASGVPYVPKPSTERETIAAKTVKSVDPNDEDVADSGNSINEETVLDIDTPAVITPAIIPPCISITAEENALSRIQKSFKLSKRELDTLRLASKNFSTKQIAENLFVAESTVNTHLKGIYRKCDVHSRKELIDLFNRFKKDQTL